MRNQYFIYTFIYFLAACIAVFRFYTRKKYTIILTEYAYVSLFILFFSFSCSLGSDWPEYKAAFLWVEQNDFLTVIKTDIDMEYPFKFFLYIISRFTSEYAVFRIIISVLIFLGLKKVFHQIFNKEYIIPLTCYLVLYGNRLLICTLRQALCVILIFKFFYYFEKEKKKAFIFFVLGITFHYSSIFLFFPLIIYKMIRKKSYYYFITLFLFFCLLLKVNLALILLEIADNLFFGHNQLTRKILIYLTGSEETSVSILDIFYVCLFLLLVYRTDKLRLWHSIAFSFIFLICVFPNNGILLSRLRYYLGISFFYLIFKEQLINKKVICILSLLFCFLSNTVSYYFSGDWERFIPYHNVISYSLFQPEKDYFDITIVKKSIYYEHLMDIK